MDFFNKAKNWVTGTTNDIIQPLNMAAPSVATTAGSQKMLKTAREKKGYTASGGRRITMRRSKHKKTHKRRH